jgi:hypothetical protein
MVDLRICRRRGVVGIIRLCMRPMASYGVVDYGSVGDVEQWCIYSDSIERCRCVVGSIINDHWS